MPSVVSCSSLQNGMWRVRIMSVTESRPRVISDTLTSENAAAFLIRVCSVCYTPVNSLLIPWPQDLGDAITWVQTWVSIFLLVSWCWGLRVGSPMFWIKCSTTELHLPTLWVKLWICSWAELPPHVIDICHFTVFLVVLISAPSDGVWWFLPPAPLLDSVTTGNSYSQI